MSLHISPLYFFSPFSFVPLFEQQIRRAVDLKWKTIHFYFLNSEHERVRWLLNLNRHSLLMKKLITIIASLAEFDWNTFSIEWIWSHVKMNQFAYHPFVIKHNIKRYGTRYFPLNHLLVLKNNMHLTNKTTASMKLKQ